ncbi:Periplasmic dipeptide transport protein precursor [Vibrio aerogenes CECT 7868]|uniref:Periplasmic dipeptide transport protein n=1 Tax=Vibrio aerogenes CECT 7868 TaxID=1216006 RepID=A0A1M5XZK6_9VIBR|nr:ABC transporter substrate-binding protein [Vibrio aerogenes]SHI05172.1 Periplasmic dipeptide transport protein precursor [Vibrio aerogenes CECT 7868]
MIIKDKFFKAALLAAAITTSGSLYAAGPHGTLNVDIDGPATGFDPAKVGDNYSMQVVGNVYDTLLTYDYLARPVKLVPNVIESMPQITNGGKTYTFKIKPGIYFADDPAFKGKKRELVAADYVYSLKRILDKTINSPTNYLLAGKFVGADKLVKAAGNGPLNYDTKIEGIKALDKYTLQLNLKEPNFNFSVIMAMPSFGAVAREVIEANAANTNAHPVGTGPYTLSDWKPGNLISLTANPNFRHKVFDFKPDPSDPVSVKVAKEMHGKTIPQIKNINIHIIEEEQPAWLAFLNKQLDLSGIPQPAYKEALVMNPDNPQDVKLAKKFVDQGISLQRTKLLEITFYFFNMEDPVVGGYTPKKIALRRAIAMAYPRAETIARIRRGQATPVNYIIPEGVAGHNPNVTSAVQYNPAKANALLDAAGYKIGADGFRTQPDGSPLSVEMGTGTAAIDREWNEFWQQTFDAVKIKLTFKTGKWNELAKMNREGKLQMWGLAWFADYPDGDNFMQMFYGPNTGDSNWSGFNLPAVNKEYEASLKLPDGPERQKLYDKINKQVAQYQPFIMGDTRISSSVTHDYVHGYKKHPIIGSWRYMSLDEKK